jgi:hypothetical protein
VRSAADQKWIEGRVIREGDIDIVEAGDGTVVSVDRRDIDV